MRAKSSKTKSRARQTLAALLEHVVAEESRLAAATRRYVWRVRGSPMQSMKRLLTEQGRQINHWLEEVVAFAQRGGFAVGPHPVEETGNDPVGGGANAEHRLIGELLRQHEHIAAELRDDVSQLEQRDIHEGMFRLLSRLLEFHETTAWMLRLLLETRDSSRD